MAQLTNHVPRLTVGPLNQDEIQLSYKRKILDRSCVPCHSPFILLLKLDNKNASHQTRHLFSNLLAVRQDVAPASADGSRNLSTAECSTGDFVYPASCGRLTSNIGCVRQDGMITSAFLVVAFFHFVQWMVG
jgi:hypothetical protein